QIAGLPLVDLAFDGRTARAMEIIIDRRRAVAMRPVYDLGRPDRHGGEKVRCRAVGPPRQRIVEEIKPPPDIVLAQSFQSVEMRLDLLPWPMQRRRGHRRRIDENLIGHQPGALVVQLERSERTRATLLVFFRKLLMLDGFGGWWI